MDLWTIAIMVGITYILGVYTFAIPSLTLSGKDRPTFFAPNYLLEEVCGGIPGGYLIVAISWIISPILSLVFWVAIMLDD